MRASFLWLVHAGEWENDLANQDTMAIQLIKLTCSHFLSSIWTLYLPCIRFLKLFFWLKIIDESAENNSVSQESIWKFDFIKRVHKGRITTLKELKIWHFERQPLVIRSNEGLTLETSAFQIFHGSNSTFIDSFDKNKFTCFTLPPMQHHSFFRNKKWAQVANS